MAKDYFQDITPPSGGNTTPRPQAPAPQKLEDEQGASATSPEPSGRGIRNIQVSQTRQKLQGSSDRAGSPPPPPPSKKSFSRVALWGGVAVALIVLGAIAFVALRPTSVTVIPRSHTVLFDDTVTFTAYPAGSATGTLVFAVETITFEDSEVVPADGVEHVEERASGTITVYNEYSASSVKLIKNTRFEAPGGLVYRTPAEVMIPGKKGSTPGEISITVFADQVGEEYNIGPVDTFRLPGLASTADMYKSVYARSTTSMTGGFSGERPAANPNDLEAAQAMIRSRLEEKIRAAVSERTGETFAFVDLARTSFESLTPTSEGEGGVRMHERVRMELPVFPADVFAYTIGESVSASAGIGAVMLKPLEGFAARLVEASGPFDTSPITFALTGRAQLVWNVDTDELASALVGRDEIAFEAIAESFPGIEAARARIEPFWKRTFPNDPSKIKITVEEPAVQ